MSVGETKTACVTGGNGYIASALIKMLLEKGYAVKKTVRNPNDMEKNSHLKDLQALGPLEILRANLDEEGSFDEAVAGCDYAFLVAFPVNLNSENPEKELVEAGVQGTLNVMRSCVKAGTIKRVVLTSSVAAICVRLLQGDGHVLDEESWSDVEYLTAEKLATNLGIRSLKGAFREGSLQIRGGEQHQPGHRVPCDHLGYSTGSGGDEAMLDLLKGVLAATDSMPIVHIDDLCRAEMFVAENEFSSGRYICCRHNTTIVELARLLAEKYPQYNVKTDCFGGFPEKPRVCLSSEKLVREGFEFKYKNLDEIFDDVIEHGKALGVLPY